MDRTDELILRASELEREISGDEDIEIDDFDGEIWICRYSESRGSAEGIEKFCNRDEIDVDKLMKKIGQIDFKESYLELFDYQFDAVLCSMDIYDFVNKKVFYADSYCLKKYKPFIDVIEYIFRKANFKSFEEMPMIHIVDNLDFAHKMAAKKFIDREYHHYFDIL